MSDIVTWDLWLHPDGRHSWRDPSSPWHQEPKEPWTRHGAIRLRRWGDESGRGRGVLPSEVRKLPAGALLAGPGRQNCGMGGPHYIYLDIRRVCRDCRSPFVFTATEQQHWFETMLLWNEIIARSCPDCRRKQRHHRISHQRLGEAIRRLEEHPDDEEAHLQAARATARLAGSIGLPGLQRGLGHARRALKRADLEADARRYEATISAEIELRAAISHSRLP
jgi:hypothetical protein